MNKQVVGSLAWAGTIIAMALAGTAARNMGYVEGDTLTRVIIGLNGLMIAWYGNRMPKAFVPSILARRVHRVGGWSLVLSGLVYAGFWAFAPIQTAVIGGCAAVIAGIAVTIGYCQALRARGTAA